ncbi:cation diffusion facilitator family transporter [Aliifodinibius sp. S!AR15-10]|uniref:cation diffusion facilitator family transporter n=1 Tax=Aliifodinibius sp. S!AR15-10 TaxID=2950437 RepID=UPI00285FF160|nr:cation diffusion facilitator family transporter [Aliifodinibius sp. S!AR15-10]MDR8391524.1 cation diffusion facilitator family transporter [Aliifodinibius sp. S!AR15-10]
MKKSRPKIALRVSLVVSLCLLLVKTSGFLVTNSTTALSDAAESFIHVLAVAFVYYGFLLSSKPADDKHLYGHERVEFLSVGVEGAVILIAGITIIYQSVNTYLTGYNLQELNTGIYLLGGAAGINFLLGRYLMKVGREEDNMMVISNARHTLTDVWTSLGVVGTLLIIKFTEWDVLDSIVGVGLALFIMYEGFKLLKYSIDGLMDSRNPKIDKKIREIMREELPGSMSNVHNLRHRTTGNTTWIELHALFEKGVSLKKAHEDATVLERRLIDGVRGDVIVTIHLEPEGHHDEIHKTLREADQERPFEDFI